MFGRGHWKISECWEYAFLSTVTYLCSLCDNSLNCMCLYIVDISVYTLEFNKILRNKIISAIPHIFTPIIVLGGKDKIRMFGN